MENQSYEEWRATNPDKNINDYYAVTGKSRVVSHFEPHPIQNKETSTFKTTGKVITIRISPWRIFLYTGVVMGSTVLWIIIFWLIVLSLFSGHIIRDILNQMFKG